MTFYRIGEYRTYPRGKRGAILTMPNTALRDLGISTGERLSLYRGNISGNPVVVAANIDTAELADEPDTQRKRERLPAQ
jgi:hypothetical protein